MVAIDFLAPAILSFLVAQGVVASKHGVLGNHGSYQHHQHFEYRQHGRPSTLHASSESTATRSSSSVLSTRRASPTTRFSTSTVPPKLTTPITTLQLELDVPDTDSSEDPISSDISTTSDMVPPTERSSSSLTPNGNKAGIAGGDAYAYFKDHIGWWYDWSPNPSKPGKPIAVPMLWGSGTTDPVDAARLTAFKKISSPPPYVLAYEEPDCPPGSGSAGMSVSSGVTGWERLIVPLGKKGSLMGSPSMCKQADETWLAAFSSKISTQWDFTAVHINKNNLDGVKKDIEHYWNKYQRPIWVTEFACVDDQNGFIPCTDQGEIDDYISTVVSYFESDSRIYAYAYSNGLGLGNVWPLMRGGSLSDSGKAYLAAVRRYH